MIVENNVPKTIEKKHIGLKVLYRLANQAIVMEGIIDGLSPDGAYIKIGKRWIENGSGYVLSILGKSKAKTRKDAFR